MGHSNRMIMLRIFQQGFASIVPHGSWPGGKASENMKRNPCNQLKKTSARNMNNIEWWFVCGDEEIAAHTRISLGDTDPLTGEAITDVTIFHGYHRGVNNEVYHNLKFSHAAMAPTPEEADRVREAKNRIRNDFGEKYGYEPDGHTVQVLYEEETSGGGMASLDQVCDSCGQEGFGERKDMSMRDPAAEAALEAVENDEVARMKAYAETLTPRQKDIYNAMLMEYDGGGLCTTNLELAERWNVSVTVIRKEQARIREGIRKAVRNSET